MMWLHKDKLQFDIDGFKSFTIYKICRSSILCVLAPAPSPVKTNCVCWAHFEHSLALYLHFGHTRAFLQHLLFCGISVQPRMTNKQPLLPENTQQSGPLDIDWALLRSCRRFFDDCFPWAFIWMPKGWNTNDCSNNLTRCPVICRRAKTWTMTAKYLPVCYVTYTDKSLSFLFDVAYSIKC